MAEVEAERAHLALEPDVLRLGERPRNLVGGDAWLDQRDRLVHPLAGPGVGVLLGARGFAHVERAAVAGPGARVGNDDVEEGLVAWAEDAGGEGVGMWAAALAPERVDGLHAVGAQPAETLGGQG